MFNRNTFEPIEPMTLGHMRKKGVRSLAVSCPQCSRETVMSADRWPDHVTISSFRPYMVCTGCGLVGADVQPNWKEKVVIMTR
jgi:hypothetical protein